MRAWHVSSPGCSKPSERYRVGLGYRWAKRRPPPDALYVGVWWNYSLGAAVVFSELAGILLGRDGDGVESGKPRE